MYMIIQEKSYTLYLTYKELVVCLCLSPRAPKKRANFCLLGSVRICSPFVYRNI